MCFEVSNQIWLLKEERLTVYALKMMMNMIMIMMMVVVVVLVTARSEGTAWKTDTQMEG